MAKKVPNQKKKSRSIDIVPQTRYIKIGFKRAKRELIAALSSTEPGTIQHEYRSDSDEKNLLREGKVSPEEVLQVVAGSQGGDHTKSRHHADPGIAVHIIKRTAAGVHWYVKWYVIDPETWFISVHH